MRGQRSTSLHADFRTPGVFTTDQRPMVGGEQGGAYVAEGRLEPDSNPVERAIRPLALGHKNYLVAGSDTGGERAAAIASLVATARLNGRDPEACLRDVLDRIADHPVTRVAELLPWNTAVSTNPN